MKKWFLSIAVVLVLTALNTTVYATPVFYSTSDPSAWSVALKIGGADGQFSSFFPATDFNPAVAVTGRPDYIANNSTGTNGTYPGSAWVFFIFRQTFDLTGFDPATTDLQFRWAADDSGQGINIRGTWTPKFSLNGGALIEYPGSPTHTYDYSSVVDLSSGFVSGLNTINFYVEGNSVTDGFALRTVNFTTQPDNPAVPEPGTMFLLGSLATGLFGFTGLRSRLRK